MIDGKISNFTPINNKIKKVFFDEGSTLGHGEFAVFIYIAMYVQFAPDAGKGVINGKQGYAYPTKTKMSAELQLSRPSINKYVESLIDAGLIVTREVANNYGGHPLLEYKVSKDYRV